jgi:hypothetical protein
MGCTLELEGRGATALLLLKDGSSAVNHDEIWKEFHELEEDLALAETREERLHLRDEMNANMAREDSE